LGKGSNFYIYAYMKHILFAAMCICAFGCYGPDGCNESISYPYWTEWTDGKLIYIVDDSLAVVTTHKDKIGCDLSNTVVIDSRLAGLFLVNYRVKQKPLLGKTMKFSEYWSISKGYIKDSSVFVFDKSNNKFGFWEIGENSIKFKNYDKVEGMIYVDNVGNWMNESVIFNSYDDVSILDTKSGQIKPFENSCIDGFMYYAKENIICVRVNRALNYSELVVDGTVTDTVNLTLKNVWFGNYVLFRDSNYNRGGRILKIDTENFKFDKTFELWIDNDYEPSKFYKRDDETFGFVSYSGKYLTGDN
jgi:hypothetical protein